MVKTTKKNVDYIKNNNLQKKNYFMHNLNLEEIAIAYRNASILVYPSIYEGFGIPILEALYSKIPVITTRVVVLRKLVELTQNMLIQKILMK